MGAGKEHDGIDVSLWVSLWLYVCQMAQYLPLHVSKMENMSFVTTTRVTVHVVMQFRSSWHADAVSWAADLNMTGELAPHGVVLTLTNVFE